jgi:hypothetical protein
VSSNHLDTAELLGVLIVHRKKFSLADSGFRSQAWADYDAAFAVMAQLSAVFFHAPGFAGRTAKQACRRFANVP